MSLASEIGQYEQAMAERRDAIRTIAETLQRSDEPYSRHVLSLTERELLLQEQGKQRYHLFSLENKWRTLITLRRRLQVIRRGGAVSCCVLGIGNLIFFRDDLRLGARIAIFFMGSMWILKDGLTFIEERSYDQQPLQSFLETHLLLVVGIAISFLLFAMVWISQLGYLCLLLFLLYVYLLFQEHRDFIGL